MEIFQPFESYLTQPEERTWTRSFPRAGSVGHNLTFSGAREHRSYPYDRRYAIDVRAKKSIPPSACPASPVRVHGQIFYAYDFQRFRLRPLKSNGSPPIKKNPTPKLFSPTPKKEQALRAFFSWDSFWPARAKSSPGALLSINGGSPPSTPIVIALSNYPESRVFHSVPEPLYALESGHFEHLSANLLASAP